jgi:hypothetical protein
MATGAYTVAERQIAEVSSNRLRQRQQAMTGSVTVEGLRLALAQLLTRADGEGSGLPDKR